MRYNSRTLGSQALSADVGYRGYHIPDTKMGKCAGENQQEVLALVEQIKCLHQEMERLSQADSVQASTADERAKLQERLEDTIAKVVDLVRPLVSKVIRSQGVRRQDDAMDILQEVLITVVEHLRKNSEIRFFLSWVDRVTIHQVCKHYKEIRKQLPVDTKPDREIESPLEDEETHSILESTPSPDPPIDTVVIQKDLANRVQRCLQSALSKDELTVISLHVHQGLPHEKIAELMQRKATWVRQTYSRARLKAATAIVLAPDILTNEEIEEAIRRCQQSADLEDRLTEEELAVLRESMQTHLRKPPGWRQVNIFREACLKVLKHINLHA